MYTVWQTNKLSNYHYLSNVSSDDVITEIRKLFVVVYEFKKIQSYSYSFDYFVFLA